MPNFPLAGHFCKTALVYGEGPTVQKPVAKSQWLSVSELQAQRESQLFAAAQLGKSLELGDRHDFPDVKHCASEEHRSAKRSVEAPAEHWLLSNGVRDEQVSLMLLPMDVAYNTLSIMLIRSTCMRLGMLLLTVLMPGLITSRKKGVTTSSKPLFNTPMSLLGMSIITVSAVFMASIAVFAAAFKQSEIILQSRSNAVV
jgi:hypothetical protein